MTGGSVMESEASS